MYCSSHNPSCVRKMDVFNRESSRSFFFSRLKRWNGQEHRPDDDFHEEDDVGILSDDYDVENDGRKRSNKKGAPPAAPDAAAGRRNRSGQQERMEMLELCIQALQTGARQNQTLVQVCNTVSSQLKETDRDNVKTTDVKSFINNQFTCLRRELKLDVHVDKVPITDLQNMVNKITDQECGGDDKSERTLYLTTLIRLVEAKKALTAAKKAKKPAKKEPSAKQQQIKALMTSRLSEGYPGGLEIGTLGEDAAAAAAGDAQDEGAPPAPDKRSKKRTTQAERGLGAYAVAKCEEARITAESNERMQKNQLEHEAAMRREAAAERDRERQDKAARRREKQELEATRRREELEHATKLKAQEMQQMLDMMLRMAKDNK